MKIRSIIVPIVALVWISCATNRKPVHVEESGFLLDTLVRISVYDRQHSKNQIKEAITRTFKVMRKLEQKTSVHVDTSEIARIVQNAGRDYVNVSPETIFLLDESAAVSRQTDGAFDITIGSIKDLWGFDQDPGRIPDSTEIEKMLPYVDYQDVMIKGNTVKLRFSPVRIDLGGIAKGYIIDRAVEFLMDQGMQAGIVEAGGDLRIWGSHPYRETWKIGIRHPRKDANTLIGILHTPAASIATSGDYERFFVKDGKRYHHLLDPQTGYPAYDCVSVTIITENATLADAYATAVFVLGPDRGMALIEDKPELEGLILYEEDGDIRYRISNGVRNQIEIF